MDRRRDLGKFLRAKRALTPVPAGAPFPTVGRRVPGLRREEVAELALISENYYTKLERGKVPGISLAVLDGLTLALSLTSQERDYIASLIPVTGIVPVPDGPASVPESLHRLIAAFGDTPVHLHNERADIIAHNATGRALYPWHFEASDQPNPIAFLFCDPRAREFFVDWREWADQGVFFLRTHLARDPGNAGLIDLVKQLYGHSPEFVEAWNSHRVLFQQTGMREINHPAVGRLKLDFQNLQPVGLDRMQVVVYTGEPRSDTAERLLRLVPTTDA